MELSGGTKTELNMNLPNETFCVLPWISLEATPSGTARPCCLADEEITDDNGNKYNLKDTQLITIQDSTYMEKLREDFLKGKKPETCRKCWAEEDSGRTSKRMNTQKRLGRILEHENQWSNTAKDLYFLDLKLGNICNLKCRICGSWSSSTSAVEELKFVTGPKKENFHYSMLEKGTWPRTAETFWSDLDFIAPGLRYLEFTGGEPFMIEEHFDFLQTLVDKKLARRIEIHYNTNGTQYPEEYIHLWKEFKHVEIAFSIDNVGRRFEYERANAKWDDVNENIEKFFKLRDTTSNISLQLCTTVNIYNVLYLEDITNWKYFDKFNFVFWNMLHDAPENCIKSLPTHVKDYVSDELLMADVDDDTLEEFKKIVTFMDSGKGVDPLPNITKMDVRRGVSLKDTHESLYRLLYE